MCDSRALPQIDAKLDTAGYWQYNHYRNLYSFLFSNWCVIQEPCFRCYVCMYANLILHDIGNIVTTVLLAIHRSSWREWQSWRVTQDKEVILQRTSDLRFTLLSFSHPISSFSSGIEYILSIIDMFWTSHLSVVLSSSWSVVMDPKVCPLFL